MQLWESAFPEHAFPKGIRSAQWKQMGWQGEDPATDFRQATQLARHLPPATPLSAWDTLLGRGHLPELHPP